MKLGFVIQTLDVGGAQRAVAAISNQMVHRGIDVSIFLLAADERCAYELDSRVGVFATGLAGSSPSLVHAVRNNVSRILRLRRVLNANKIDVVVGMSYSVNVLVSLATMGTAIVPIGSERSHPEHDVVGVLWQKFRAVCYRRLKTLVCLTRETADWVLANTQVQRVEVIPNGIKLPLASTTPVVNVPDSYLDKKIVLSVGRLVVTKQFDQLISVFSAVAGSNPDWILVIAGDGPLRDDLQAQIDSSGFADRITLLGSVGNLDDWYRGADVFVFLSNIEGFPNSLLEAMAYGLACISYDCKTGPKDLIQDGVNGELIPLDDLESVETRLSRLLGDDGYRAGLRLNASETCNTFALDKVADQWFHLLSSSCTQYNNGNNNQ